MKGADKNVQQNKKPAGRFRSQSDNGRKMLGMSQTGYSKYETGENDVPTAILIKLAEYYKTNVDYILGLTDNPIYYKEI